MPFWQCFQFGKKLLLSLLIKKIKKMGGYAVLWIHLVSIITLRPCKIADFNAPSNVRVFEGSVKTSSELNALKLISFEVWCWVGVCIFGRIKLQPMLSADAVSSFAAIDGCEIKWSVDVC